MTSPCYSILCVISCCSNYQAGTICYTDLVLKISDFFMQEWRKNIKNTSKIPQDHEEYFRIIPAVIKLKNLQESDVLTIGWRALLFLRQLRNDYTYCPQSEESLGLSDYPRGHRRSFCTVMLKFQG